MQRKGGYLKLVTLGRRSGVPHVVELRYVYRDGSFYVLSGSDKSDWLLNALAAGHVKVRLDGLVYDSSVRTPDPTESEAASMAFAAKYGRSLMETWYPKSAPMVALVAGKPEVRGARGEADTQTDFRGWASKGHEYYGDVSWAFDSASEEYDFTIGRNYINSWIRRRSIGILLGYTRRDDVLLEVGCGTGKEAIEISKSVREVVATDISSGMVDLLRRKLASSRMPRRVTPVKVGASEIAQVSGRLPGGKVRVSYSFNGALNCEPKLADFATQLAGLLEPEGLFLCSIRNTLCLSEMVAHAAALQFDKATPRKKQPIMISVGGVDIPSTYYSPGEFAGFFRPHFRVEKLVALPGLLPPAYLSDYYLQARPLAPMIERAELALSGHFPLNRFGDQSFFVFRKNGP